MHIFWCVALPCAINVVSQWTFSLDFLKLLRVVCTMPATKTLLGKKKREETGFSVGNLRGQIVLKTEICVSDV